MQWLLTKTCAIRFLVALFLVAQFAGIVPSPLAQAHVAAGALAAHAGHHQVHKHQGNGQHAEDHRHGGCVQSDAGACGPADYCCALHAFFAGILPPAAAIGNLLVVGEALRPAVTDVALGLQPGRLDRPPRPLS